MRIAIASDHAGFGLKQELVDAIQEAGHTPLDLGPQNAERVDYPDYAKVVAEHIQSQNADLGVLVCGSGIGMSMAANRHKGVRAVVCALEIQAELARAHNHANVLCLGERLTGPSLARAILDRFLTTSFEGGRHAGRVEKIEAL